MTCPHIHIATLVTALYAAASMLCACTRTSEAPVPRRTAYPRIAPYDTAYTAINAIPLRIMANTQARTSTETRPDGSVWVSIAYPRYGATVYCSITPVDANTIGKVIDNRAERIHRNIGASRPEFIESVNAAGYYSNIVLTPSAASTPVQFMSYSEAEPRWVVSGSVFFDHAAPSTSIDSIMPMVDVLRRDVVYMLDNISDR